MEQHSTGSIFGLNLFGVVAISLVLLAQCIWIFPQSTALISQLASLFHFIGIEIFFVLTGFLLGKIMYAKFLKENFGGTTVWIFFRKRILHIVGLYYVVLLLNILIAFGIGYPIERAWTYIFFLQNFASPMPAFFPESWVISIVFFATMLFTSLLLVLNFFLQPQNKSKTFLNVIIFLIVLCLILKWFYNLNAFQGDMHQWDIALKSIVIYRMDSVFIGVLSSWLLYHFESFFQKTKIIFATLGIVGVAFIFVGVGYFQLTIAHYKLFWNVLYLPMISFFLAFFLPVLYQWRNVFPFISKPVAFVSNITYPIYLLYLSVVLQLLQYWFKDFFVTPKQLVVLCATYLLLVLLVGILICYSLKRLLQKPLRQI